MASPWDAAFLRGAIKGGAGVGGAFKGYSSAMMRRQQGGDDAAKKALLAQLDQAVRAAVAQNQGLPLDAGAQQEIMAGFPALQGADLNYLYTQGLFGKPETPEPPAKMTPYQAFEVHKALGGGKKKEKSPGEIEGESLDLDYKRLRNQGMRDDAAKEAAPPDPQKRLLEVEKEIASIERAAKTRGGDKLKLNASETIRLAALRAEAQLIGDRLRNALAQQILGTGGPSSPARAGTPPPAGSMPGDEELMRAMGF